MIQILLKDAKNGCEAALPGRDDVPFELYSAVDGVQLVCAGENTVGAVLAEGGFCCVYILPDFRGRGYGSAALELAERWISPNRSRILGSFRGDEGGGFARAHGYEPVYASALLRRDDIFSDENSAKIRQYLDGDYPDAHELYACAFHRMRVATGLFPRSTQEQSSELMRREWAETAGERYVFVEACRVVGYAHVCGSTIASVAVAPEFQRRGIGEAFIRGLCAIIRQNGFSKVELMCVVGNPARSLYDRLGFYELAVDGFAAKTLRK